MERFDIGFLKKIDTGFLAYRIKSESKRGYYIEDHRKILEMMLSEVMSNKKGAKEAGNMTDPVTGNSETGKDVQKNKIELKM